MPDLTVTLVRQTYRTVSISEDGAVINYTDANRTADIVVDTDGLPVSYPEVARASDFLVGYRVDVASEAIRHVRVRPA